MKYYPPRFLFRRYEIMRRVRRGQHFLEIGPGNLGLAQELLSRFERGTLIDFNTTEVQRIYEALEPRARQRLELILGDFVKYDQFGRQFDCVVSCEVLEHVQDDMRFLCRANDLLAPGGQLMLSVPARQKYWSRDDEIVGHYRRYEKQELRDKLAEAGFSQIQIVSYGFPFENLVRLARIALARLQYKEKGGWDQEKQSQESGFMLKRRPVLSLVALVMNKYTLLPFNLFASLFNSLDLAEGYIASAFKPAA